MGVRKSCGAEGGRVCTVDGDAGRSGRRGKGELGHHDHDEVGDCARRGDAGARRRDAGPAEDFVEERAPLGILEGGSVAPSNKNKSTQASPRRRARLAVVHPRVASAFGVVRRDIKYRVHMCARASMTPRSCG